MRAMDSVPRTSLQSVKIRMVPVQYITSVRTLSFCQKRLLYVSRGTTVVVVDSIGIFAVPQTTFSFSTFIATNNTSTMQVMEL